MQLKYQLKVYTILKEPKTSPLRAEVVTSVAQQQMTSITWVSQKMQYSTKMHIDKFMEDHTNKQTIQRDSRPFGLKQT